MVSIKRITGKSVGYTKDEELEKLIYLSKTKGAKEHYCITCNRRTTWINGECRHGKGHEKETPEKKYYCACGKETMRGIKECDDCRKKRLIIENNKYVCSECGGYKHKDSTNCYKCGMRKFNVEKKNNVQSVDKKMCHYCGGKKLTGYNYCGSCYELEQKSDEKLLDLLDYYDRKKARIKLIMDTRKKVVEEKNYD